MVLDNQHVGLCTKRRSIGSEIIAVGCMIDTVDARYVHLYAISGGG